MKSLCLRLPSPALGLLTVLLLLSACHHTSNKQPDSAIALAALGVSAQTLTEQLNSLESQLAQTYDTELQKMEQASTIAAQNVFSASIVTRENPKDDAHRMVLANELETAALALPDPDYRKEDEVLRRLSQALDENLLVLEEQEAEGLLVKQELARIEIEYAEAKKTRQQTQEEAEETRGKIQQVSVDIDKKVEQVAANAAAREQLAIENEKEQGRIFRKKIASWFVGIGGSILIAGILAGAIFAKMVLLPAVSSGSIFVGVGTSLKHLNVAAENKWFLIGAGLITLLVLIAAALWVIHKLKERRKEIRVNKHISDNMAVVREKLREHDTANNTQLSTVFNKYLHEWNVTDNGDPDGELEEEIEKRAKQLKAS